jgi:hypothetical protein
MMTTIGIATLQEGVPTDVPNTAMRATLSKSTILLEKIIAGRPIKQLMMPSPDMYCTNTLAWPWTLYWGLDVISTRTNDGITTIRIEETSE